MYSTSSTDCNCGMIYGQESYEIFQEQRLYSSLDQPFVYYAQVPKRRRQSRSETRKGNPNFFVKAFRWYTQEHCSSRKNELQNSPDWAGFTTWLDNKYKQYQLENKDVNYLELEDTSILKSSEIENRAMFELRKTKIFSRMRSPWKKRKRVKSKEDNDIRRRQASDFGACRSHHSCSYIMKPKDTPYTPSVCCHVPSALCCAAKESIKTITKSQSFTDSRVFKEKTSSRAIDVVSVQEGVKKKSSEEVTKTYRHINTSPAVMSLAKQCDADCQYKEDTVEKRDAQTQYEEFPSKTQLDSTLVLETDERKLLQPEKNSHGAMAVIEWRKIKKPKKTSATCLCTGSSGNRSNAQSQSSIICQCSSTDNKVAIEHSHETVKPDVVSGKTHARTAKVLRNRTITCQCPGKRVNITDSEARYQSNMVCPCPSTDNKISSDTKTLTEQGASSRFVKIAQDHTPPIVLPRDAGSSANHFVARILPGNNRDILVNDAAQTSDHSIILDHNATQKYPLFMKIITTNK